LPAWRPSWRDARGRFHLRRAPCQLEEDVRIARDFLPLSPAQLEALEQKVKPVYGQAQWFKRDAPANPPK